MDYVKTVLIIVGVFLALWFLAGLGKEKWTGLYEDKEAFNPIHTVEFYSREECIAWLENMQASPGGFTNFECGKNCKPPETSIGPYRCAETF